MRGLGTQREDAEAQLAEATFDRLAWRYGHERAVNIIEGKDSATEADIAIWRRIGTRTNATSIHS